MGVLDARSLRRLYVNRVANAMGNGLVVPFFEYYASRIGATPLQISGVQGISQLVPNALQVAWGWWSDKVSRRLPFVIAGTLVVVLSFVLMALLPGDVGVLLSLIAVYAVGVSIIAPTWSSFVGESALPGHRGETLAQLAQATQVASVGGIILAGVFFAFRAAFDPSSFRISFSIGAGFVLAAVIVLSTVRESPAAKPAEDPTGNNGFRVFLRKSGVYRRFLTVQCFFVFFMSLIWGVIPVTVTRDLHATNLDLVVISLAGAIPVLFVQRAIGRTSDRTGALPLLQWTRLLYVPVPLVYALAAEAAARGVVAPTTGIWFIVAIEVPLAIAVAAGNIAFTAYLLDLAPREMHAKALGLYNALVGSCAFVGIMAGGVLVQLLTGVLGAAVAATTVVYILSTVGRGVGASLYFKLQPMPMIAALRHRVGEVFVIHGHWRRFRMG